jgi:hypothetical protein
MPRGTGGTASGSGTTVCTRINLRRTQDTQIYRIIPVNRLYELFDNKENVLPRPPKWEDPFENFILKSPVQISSGEVGNFAFHDDVYGQCWTLHKASDAMWRIYSPNKDAVRIRTTMEKLANSLSAGLGRWAHVQSFIGKVDYLFKAELKKFAETVFEDGLNPAAIARSLLVKRRAFRHEREIRLIYCERERVKHTDGLYRYAIDPHTLIEQIMVDPRLPKPKADQLKSEIRDQTGFQGELKRSFLYAPPKGFLIRMP